MRSGIYNSKSGVTRLIREGGGGRAIIPAWRKGDRVLHRPSGFYGQLTEMATAGGELWKMCITDAVPGSDGASILSNFNGTYHVQVHACDLELRT